MFFKMMGERFRVCVACSEPSPGPTKRLYYQHRDYGPFFPILEEMRRNSNGCLYSGGRVAVCTGCASHLLRQWAYYEKNWTPLEKRTYTLFSEERLARRAFKESLMVKVAMESNEDPLNDQENHLSKSSKFSPRDGGDFSHETMSDKVKSSTLKERLSPLSFVSEGNNPFGRALKKVSQQNTRILAEYNEANKHSDLSHPQSLDKSEQWHSEEAIDGRKSLWSLPSEEIRLKVREELQENIDVMIRKVAEIQYYENLRKYEKELKDAAERMCRVQDSKGDIDRMCQSLKAQLQEELLFRDTLKVLNEEKKETNGEEKALLGLEPPPMTQPETRSRKHSSKPTMTRVTNAKKAGKEWKGKAVRKKLREKAAANQPTEDSLALVPVPNEEEIEPKPSSRSDTERKSSASRKLDVVVRELEREREWRKKTESVIAHQREMIEELRSGIQGEVQRLIGEQNKRYRDIKANAGKSPRRQLTTGSRTSPNGLNKPSNHKNPHISLERPSSVEHDATHEDDERMRSRERRRQRKDRSRDWTYKGDVPSPARNKKYDDDDKKNGDQSDDDDDDDEDDDGVTADSEDEGSSPPTPEFYIQ